LKGNYRGSIRNDGHNTELQVLNQPNIGLDCNVRHSVLEILNHTLANEVVLIEKLARALGMLRMLRSSVETAPIHGESQKGL